MIYCLPPQVGKMQQTFLRALIEDVAQHKLHQCNPHRCTFKVGDTGLQLGHAGRVTRGLSNGLAATEA